MDFKARIIGLPKMKEEGIYNEIDIKFDVDWFQSADVLISSDILSVSDHDYLVAAIKEIPIRYIESDNDYFGFWYRLKFINPKQVYVTKNIFEGSSWVKIGTIDHFSKNIDQNVINEIRSLI